MLMLQRLLPQAGTGSCPQVTLNVNLSSENYNKQGKVKIVGSKSESLPGKYQDQDRDRDQDQDWDINTTKWESAICVRMQKPSSVRNFCHRAST